MSAKKSTTAKGGAKKTKTAAKAKAPKQESIFSHFKLELWGVGCGLLSLLIILSSFAKQSAMARVFMGLVGEVGLYILPVGLILCAVALLFHGGRPVTMRVLCSISFALLGSAIAHLVLSADSITWDGKLISTLFQTGIDGQSGGLLGGLVAMLFSLLGGKVVAWAICLILLLVTALASVNLTITGLLRAINNHREELRRQKPKQEEYREPAEVLVEHVVQRRQEREIRRRERSRFDFDLPVDGPVDSTVKPAKKSEPVSQHEPPVAEPQQPEEVPEPAGYAGQQMEIRDLPVQPEPKPQPAAHSRVDIPIDEPPLPVTDYVPAPDQILTDLPLSDGRRPAARPVAVEYTAPAVAEEAEPVEQTAWQPAAVPAAASVPAAVQPVHRAEPAPAEALPELEDEPRKIKPSETRRAAREVGAQILEQQLQPQTQAYVYPDISLLSDSRAGAVDASAEMRENTRRLQEKLSCFNVEAEIVNVTRGPSVTMYELQLAQGVRLSRLTGLADDIALELGASGVRISAIPDKNSMVGIEVPNKTVSPVHIREVIGSGAFSQAKSKVSFAVGKDISGSAIVGDIAKMPHILIAGTTGSGKSVCMNSLIISLLYKSSPEDVKLIMVDPKMVELGIYNGIPHLLIPVVTDPKKAAGALQWGVTEMMRRYRMMSEAGVREIESYNKLAKQNPDLKHMEKIIVIIDELADLMMVAGKEVEESICRIAQMGRAAGVHLVIATQRPSADVITGLMKANIPSRIAFAVASAMESRIILDTMGAEKLIGKGDMLYAPLGKGKKRVQGCLISDEEIQRVTDFIKAQGAAEYSDDIQQQIDIRAAQSGKGGKDSASAAPAPENETEGGDELLPAAVEVILETGQASVSMLQRRLKLGYARAARIVDEMEERGIVGPFEGSKPRQLLITKEQWDAMQNQAGAPAGYPADNEPVEDLID